MQNLQGLGQKPLHKEDLTQRKITDTGMALGWYWNVLEWRWNGALCTGRALEW